MAWMLLVGIVFGAASCAVGVFLGLAASELASRRESTNIDFP